MPKEIIVNCQKLPFENTLGVAGYLLNLCSEMAKNNTITFAVKDPDTIQNTPAYPIIKDMDAKIIALSDARNSPAIGSSGAIELLPHHFQAPLLSEKSILICHDMHVFDIGWKYKNVEQVRSSFRKNLTSATAVMTEFPRTFYDLESIADITLMNLYLTDTPLLLDTRNRPAQGGKSKIVQNPFLLYPAQLQAHKNHEVLVKAVHLLKKKGHTVKIICPGSDFHVELTDSLKALAHKYGVDGLVQFPGRVSDQALYDMYQECVGVIIPSKAEGGAYVAFESIAAEKPVAVNDIKSARQHLKMVRGEVLWFDAEDENLTAYIIEQLMSTEVQQIRVRNEICRKRIDQMTWARVAHQFQRVVDWLAGEKDRPVMCMDRGGWNIQYR